MFQPIVYISKPHIYFVKNLISPDFIVDNMYIVWNLDKLVILQGLIIILLIENLYLYKLLLAVMELFFKISINKKKSKLHRQLIFSKMAGMDQLREQVMDNHGKVYRSLMRIQDDLSIQGRGCN